MGFERLIRNRLCLGALLAFALGYAAIPAAGVAEGAAHAVAAKAKTCGQGSSCTLSLSSPPPPATSPGGSTGPGSSGGSGGGGGGGVGGTPPPPTASPPPSPAPAYSTINVDTKAKHGRIESGSKLVGARDAGHKLVCRGYTRRDRSWFQFLLTSKTRFGITYEVKDTIHNTTREGVHICAGLGYKFKTFSGHLARRATLPDGRKGYVGLLPLCKEDANGTVLSAGPCVTFIVEGANGSGGTDTILGAQIPATSQADPWMGG